MSYDQAAELQRLTANDPEGLDGNGTTHAADLPSRVWGSLWPTSAVDTLDEHADAPVTRRYCLEVEPGYALIPGRCRLLPEHAGEHDWTGGNKNARLSELAHRAIARGDQTPAARTLEPDEDSPSGRLWPRVARREA